MSSSQEYQASSPISTGHSRRRSRFTYKHLSQLATSSTTCPLRVIAHIDLDAFYAQCEMVRLGIPDDKPLAVQQWQGLIAINYPARKFGLNRHVTITEAKKLCPELICQHVATWKEGEATWGYHDDAFANIATHKVSLDPYRLQCRRILACIKDSLPASVRKVEKASIDEVFLDLSAQVHSILLERFPELSLPAPYDDPSESLPMPPTTALDWQADALVDVDEHEKEEDDPDWDDIVILIGSEIVRAVRQSIYEQLKYTCSAGIARNKMLAKLGSAHRKPNQQTVIRNRAVQQFLSKFKFTKIRNLGGKLGDQIVASFETDTVKDLLNFPIEQLKQKLGDETGVWVHQVIRGIDNSEVNPRTQIKSMLSAKSFRPSINTPEQATRWLHIFAADIYARMVEEGVVENKRRPKTMNLHYRQGAQTRARSCPIPLAKKLDAGVLFDLAKNLLGQIILEGRVWPCANLSLAVAGFEDGITGNMSIGSFLVKGDEAKALLNSSPKSDKSESRPEKRRRVDDGGITRFFSKIDSVEDHDDEFGSQQTFEDPTDTPDNKKAGGPGSEEGPANKTNSPGKSPLQQASLEQYTCSRCSAVMDSDEDLQSHNDWHFAKDLQAEDHAQVAPKKPIQKPKPTATKKSAASAKVEKGQSKLAFGR